MPEEKIEIEVKTTNAALYDGGNVSVLLTFTGPEGGLRFPGIQVLTRPGRPVPPGFPENGRMTLPEAVLVLKLLERAVDAALGTSTLIFAPPEPPAPPSGKNSVAKSHRHKK